MALNGRVFFDSSVLLAGLLDIGEASADGQVMLDAVADGRIPEALTAWHCCLEIFSVATRLPEEYRVEPAAAARLLDEEILSRFRVVQLPPGEVPCFFGAAATDGVQGGRVYDLHIAEVARRAEAKEVVTDNRRHFVSLLRHGVRVLTSAEAVEELPALDPTIDADQPQ